MMVKKVLGIVLFLLLAAGGVECRRHPDHRRRDGPMLFVFGDSFVDAGNLARTSEKSAASRQWFYPYGSSDSAHHNNPTGRVSDGLVQSDSLARMLGFDESPPAHRLQQSKNDVDASGVNFATATAGAKGTLSRQIDQLSRLVTRGTIEDRDLDHSVALIAFNGASDYAGVTISTSSDEVMSLSDKVTDAIADGVRRLLDLGVSKVMVNSLPPLGCTPFMSQMFNYDTCDPAANRASDMHNKVLSKKLDQLDDVLVLDINSIFSDLARGNYKACCTGTDERNGGYCGREDARGTAQYTLCSNPQDFFYWDYMHPTQAGWNAVMDRLQGPIQDFLRN